MDVQQDWKQDPSGRSDAFRRIQEDPGQRCKMELIYSPLEKHRLVIEGLTAGRDIQLAVLHPGSNTAPGCRRKQEFRPGPSRLQGPLKGIPIPPAGRQSPAGTKTRRAGIQDGRDVVDFDKRSDSVRHRLRAGLENFGQRRLSFDPRRPSTPDASTPDGRPQTGRLFKLMDLTPEANRSTL